jgi:hypothetical protein
MTIGTAIVVSIGIICVTFLALVGIGVYLQNKKQQTASKLADNIFKNIKKE